MEDKLNQLQISVHQDQDVSIFLTASYLEPVFNFIISIISSIVILWLYFDTSDPIFSPILIFIVVVLILLGLFSIFTEFRNIISSNIQISPIFLITNSTEIPETFIQLPGKEPVEIKDPYPIQKKVDDHYKTEFLLGKNSQISTKSISISENETFQIIVEDKPISINLSTFDLKFMGTVSLTIDFITTKK